MNQERILSVLLAPITTEKTSLRMGENQYVFKVASDANKLEIKKAVEKLFKVAVEKVQILNIKPRNKVFRQQKGCRKGWKKAYVCLRDGHTIQFDAA